MKCIQHDMANLLAASYTDPDFEDLIEWAFLEGQIDGETMIRATILSKLHLLTSDNCRSVSPYHLQMQ